jgi:hypothetical protein
MKQEELDPDKRLWEYDGDGLQIYKLECGFGSKTLWDGGHAFYMKKLIEHDQDRICWVDRMTFWSKIP